jgi:hypothetical protein
VVNPSCNALLFLSNSINLTIRSVCNEFLARVELLEHIPKPQPLPPRCQFIPSPAVLSPLVEIATHHHSAPIVLQFPYHNLQVMQQHCERTFAACNPAFRFTLAPLHRINRSLLGLTSRAIFATCRIHAHNSNLVLHTLMHFALNHNASIAPPLPSITDALVGTAAECRHYRNTALTNSWFPS